MCKKLTIIIVVALSVSLAGCGLLRQTKLDLAKEDTKNIETCREVGLELKSTWLFKSGLIRSVLRTEQLPVETMMAMDKCDELAAKEELTDFEIGIFIGSMMRIINTVTMKVFQQYAPEILEVLPAFL